jgi:hypothetical protein
MIGSRGLSESPTPAAALVVATSALPGPACAKVVRVVACTPGGLHARKLSEFFRSGCSWIRRRSARVGEESNADRSNDRANDLHEVGYLVEASEDRAETAQGGKRGQRDGASP